LPAVSIIIPTYNSERTIERTVNSCLTQTYKNIEVIVIDDGSTDQTGNILKSINDSRIRYYYFENSGRSSARNKGLKLAKGKYIQFLDSDDTIEIDKIEKAMTILDNNPNIDAVQCGTRFWYGNQIVCEYKAKKRKKIEKLLLRENLFPIHSIIFKKELAASFPEDISHCEDWYFWVKTLLGANIFFQSDYFGANVFIHGNNTMSNYRDMLLGEINVLFRIRNEINAHSLTRDLKIIKQYVNYCIKYNGNDLCEMEKSLFHTLSFLKYINYVVSYPTIKILLTKIIKLKNKFLKKENLY
jgi:glycosyltransferase involved in cell wall biosynthesis